MAKLNCAAMSVLTSVTLLLGCPTPNQAEDGGPTGGSNGGGGEMAGMGGGDGMQPIDAGHPITGSPFVYAVSGNGKVLVYTLDAGTAGLTYTSEITTPGGPNFLAFSVDRRTAYVSKNNSVDALKINPLTGALTFINSVSSAGAGCVHVFTERTGKNLLVANFTEGNAAVLPILDGGALGTATSVVTTGVEAHQIVVDPSNRFAFVPCKNADWVAQFLFDADAGTLIPNAVPHLTTASQAGPRHLAFHPNGELAYLINEEDSTLTALTLDTGTGRLTPFQTVSTIPMPIAGNTTAEVEVHPSGKFVYGSNRGHNSIVAFSLDASGHMTLIGHASTGGMTPRHFSIDPTGTLLFVANQDSSTVHALRINLTTGALTPLGEKAQPAAPNFVGAVYLPSSLP